MDARIAALCTAAVACTTNYKKIYNLSEVRYLPLKPPQ